MASKTIGPVARGVLARVDQARGEHLRQGKGDLIWAEIGRAMGWTPPTTSAVKNGKRPVDLEELPDLAHILGVRVAWLAVGDGPMVAQKGDPEMNAALDDVIRTHPADSTTQPRKGRRTG